MSKRNRPKWDEYLMDLAFFVSARSLDPSTQHGCVVVDDDNTILSTGYNNPPRGCNDEEIPMERPSKYNFFVHAEEAAIINAARSGVSLKGSTFYITGYPCPRCFRGIVNVGAKKIVYGCVKSACVSEEEKDAIKTMNKIWENRRNGKGLNDEFYFGGFKIEMIEYNGVCGNAMRDRIKYIEEKCGKTV